VYFALDTLKLVEVVAGKNINRHHVKKYAKGHDLILPKYMRKVAWRPMVKTMRPQEACS